MTSPQHYRQLETMYRSAPVNDIYQAEIEIAEGQASIEIEVSEKYHHSAGAAHGSVYFKMLDDAAFFAANSYETDVFLLTTSFTTYLTRPVSTGVLRAIGKVVNKNRSQFISEAVLYNDSGKEIGRGNGIFIRSKVLLENTKGYAPSLD